MTGQASPLEGTPNRPGRAPRPIWVRFAVGLVALPFTILEFIGRAGFYGSWYLLFFVLCVLRPFTAFMVVGAIVMLPMTLAVLHNPDAANGMPFWVLPLGSAALIALAFGYNVLLDWLTPPGASDPFAHFRRPFRP